MAKFPKEKSPYTPLLYLLIIVIGFIIGSFCGIALDNARDENGKVDFRQLKAPDISFSVLNDSLKDDDSNAKKGGVAGAFVVFLGIAQATANKKRFHRKGEEHGSAQWGNGAEKRKLADRGIIVGKKMIWQWLPFPHKVEAEVRVPYQVYSMLNRDYTGEVKLTVIEKKGKKKCL
jgi:hypothetical protein